MIFLLLLSSVFILFLHLLHFVFPSILPSIPALFPSFLFPFGDCGGQGPTFCRSQQSCCFCLRSRFPANTRCVSHGWQFFPVAHQNSVPFLWNSVCGAFSTACCRHESHPSKFLYICEFYFPHCIKSHVLPAPNPFLLTCSGELQDTPLLLLFFQCHP